MDHQQEPVLTAMSMDVDSHQVTVDTAAAGAVEGMIEAKVDAIAAVRLEGEVNGSEEPVEGKGGGAGEKFEAFQMAEEEIVETRLEEAVVEPVAEMAVDQRRDTTEDRMDTAEDNAVTESPPRTESHPPTESQPQLSPLTTEVEPAKTESEPHPSKDFSPHQSPITAEVEPLIVGADSQLEPETTPQPPAAVANSSPSLPALRETESEPFPALLPEPPMLPQAVSEAPAVNGKVSREREEDVEDAPATKRSRIEADTSASAEPEFKVPALPQSVQSFASAETGQASPEAQSGSNVITKSQHRFLQSVVRNLKRNKESGPFNTPVDPIALGIPTYFDVIKQPMDVGTMDDKLKNDKYSTVEEFVADFNLIIQNTLTFNGPDHVVTLKGMSLKASFDKQMSNYPKADAGEPHKAQKKGKKSATTSASKAGPARRESRSSLGTAKSPTTAASPTTFALGPSGTPLIRRDSTAGDGRPKREIHPPPPRDLPYLASKPKKKKFQWELKFCQEIMTELFKPKYKDIAVPFYNPVDPVAENIPHYHKIVKKPMDLGTIRSKLKSGQYENAKEFEADVRLMFSNCFKFNPAGDPVHQLGRRLEQVFNDKWSQKKQWIDDHAPVSGPQSPVTVTEPEEEEEDEEEDEEDEPEQLEIKLLQAQIEAMSKHLELMQKKKGSPPVSAKKKSKAPKSEKKQNKKKTAAAAAPATVAPKVEKKKKSTSKKERTPYITYEQKQEISNRINTLPPAKMSTALKIIRDNMPNLQGLQQDELELDIDELSDEVLHKLYQFVQKYAPKVAEPEDSPKPARTKQSSASRAGTGKPKKNKPMSKMEQEARINEIQGRLKSYHNAGSDESPEPDKKDDEHESSGDEDESGSESEEE